ncbi:uncharacterized protein LOC119691908 [Plutella xylostella]|uniref:uncharacterized protein LOC119691908 n=1 Tax=Plutella xylostella TaxID=51655 RepID=UPI0020329285|nr:uncharacterized protein LOC119691908 [Plutella xylostella]
MAVWNQDDDYRVSVECKASSGLQDLFVDFDQWVLKFQGKFNLRRLHHEKADTRKDQETASPVRLIAYQRDNDVNNAQRITLDCQRLNTTLDASRAYSDYVLLKLNTENGIRRILIKYTKSKL